MASQIQTVALAGVDAGFACLPGQIPGEATAVPFTEAGVRAQMSQHVLAAVGQEDLAESEILRAAAAGLVTVAIWSPSIIATVAAVGT